MAGEWSVDVPTTQLSNEEELMLCSGVDLGSEINFVTNNFSSIKR
jgi:hypothetical protein